MSHRIAKWKLASTGYEEKEAKQRQKEEEEEKAEVRSRRTGGWQEPLDPAGYGKSDRAVGFLPENHDERVVVQENEQVANERLERDQ